MKKQIAIKNILGVMLFVFTLFLGQTIWPEQTFGANELYWENPNSYNKKNPYEFNSKDVLNSKIIMQVIGCTSVVDKVSSAMMDFTKDILLKEQLESILTEKMIDKAVKACKAGKTATKTSVVGIINMNWPGVIDEIDCKPTEKVKDVYAQQELKKQTQKLEANKKREECFNGIAIKLAKNQLTSMARNTMNWVNSGFKGDPMYVRNITSFTNSIEKNILEKNIAQLFNSNKAYPYGTDFSRSIINGYKTGRGFRSGATNFLDSLTSDLGSFLSDPESYYGYSEKRAKERAQEANERFSNDFSVGGWDGWLALTQRDQNNPLGFTMQASQHLADQQESEVQNTKNELLTNNGLLSQKKCVLWDLYDKENEAVYDEHDNIITSTSKPGDDYPNSICRKFEVVTPGSIIKDKLSTYINSPERQLELADTINKSLNTLFSNLISKFQNQGLASLSSEKYEYTTDNGTPNVNMGLGYGSQEFDDLEFSSYSAGAGYSNGSFDLTRDLGNTYIHNYTKESLGNWNAKLNIIENTDPAEKLYVGLGPVDKNGEYLTNVYYTVKVPGNTKLFNDGFNGWAIGDRAFWNGEEWQNWKKGTENPIDKKGIIQIQYDYIVAAKEMLSSLPSIMPKIGELDYCIPGPNPSWQSNSANAEALFLEYANSIGSTYFDGGFLTRDYTTFKIAQPGEPEYDNYKAVFDGTKPGIWEAVKGNFDYLQWLGSGTLKKDEKEAERQKAIESALDEINTDFKDFYRLADIMFKKLFGRDGFIQKEFFEKENSSELIPNPSFIPMAEEGLKITRNIISYDENIKTARTNYKDAIAQANSNIHKMNAIKAKVSIIIKAAQDRRDANLIKIINEQTLKECNDKYVRCMSTGYGLSPEEASRTGERGQLCSAKKQICEADKLTPEEYKEKYKECLKEEDILYYDDTGIMNMGEGERCYDEFDNDLDGLIDMKDPDCQGVCPNGANNPPACTTLQGVCLNQANNPPDCNYFGTGKHCWLDETDPPKQTTLSNNTECEMRQTEEDCTTTPWVKHNKARTCYWDGPTIE